MKRFRVMGMDFDARAYWLSQKIQDNWEETVKARHHSNREMMKAGLREEYGAWQFEAKLQNFIDLGSKPFSILAFHNRFFEQCRRSFVVGAYYPALTGACALGERLLNHLVLTLRDDFKSSQQYKQGCGRREWRWPTRPDRL